MSALRTTPAAAAALLLAGCAALDRGTENVAVVLTFPVHAVTTPAARLRDRYAEDPQGTVALSPIFAPLYLFEDVCFTAASAVDGALTLFYAPFEVEPLGLYDLSGAAPRLRTDELRASEEKFLHAASGVLYVFALVGYACRGEGGCWPAPAPPPREP